MNNSNSQCSIAISDQTIMESKSTDNIIKYEARKCRNNVPDRITISWQCLTIKRQQTKNVLKKHSSASNKKGHKMINILEEVAGIVEPGEILAVMGPSGSGKTSLLNALSFSTRAPLISQGKVMLNGCQADMVRMNMVSRYIQQEDLFFGTLTVKEHLTFHAMLRLDRSLSKEEKVKRVEWVLTEFNLINSANVKIGIPGRIKGISGGEKRRLSFASEILTDPALLFCDEPTSGLDSYLAQSIIYHLRKMAQNGKTIICSIHQPSSEIFNSFDKFLLLLLKRICFLSRSRLAFYGSANDAMKFFTINLRKEIPQFTNPADFFMNSLSVNPNDSEKTIAQVNGYCDEFARSEFHSKLIEKINEIKQPECFNVPKITHLNSKWTDQLFYLYKRNIINYFRNRNVMITDFSIVLITALLGGLFYFQTGSRENGVCTFKQGSIVNVGNAINYMVMSCLLFSTLGAIMVFPLELPIYYREYSGSVYRSDAYYFSKILFEVPLNMIFSITHAIIIFYLVGFGCSPTETLLFILANILIGQVSYALGHVVSAISNDVSVAISLCAPVIAVQTMFTSYFLNRTLHTPSFLTWIRYLSIFNYSFEFLMINTWENVESIQCDLQSSLMCFNNGMDVLNDAKINPNSKTFNGVMLLVLTIGFRILAYLIISLKGFRIRDKLSNLLLNRL